MSTKNFTVQRLQLWQYFRSIHPGDLPQKYQDLEKLIKDSFLRYFGLDQEWLEVNKSKFDFKSFEKSVSTFVKRVKHWGGKSKCMGYGEGFQGKPFMQEALSLEKNLDEEEEENDEEKEENDEADDADEDNVGEMPESDDDVDNQPAFEDFSDRHQRRLAEQLRENNDSEVILKVNQNLNL